MNRTFRVGDTPLFGLLARDENGQPIDVTGASTRIFRFKIGAAAALERTASVIDGPAGLIRYQAIPGDLSIAGDMWWEWEVKVGSRGGHAPPQRRFAKVIDKLV